VLKERGIDFGHRIEVYPEKIPSVLDTVMEGTGQPLMEAEIELKAREAKEEMDEFGRHLLLDAFRRMGMFHDGGERYGRGELKGRLGIVPGYSRLYEELLEILSRTGFISIEGGEIVIADELDNKGLLSKLEGLAAEKDRLLGEYPQAQAHVNLLWTCLKHYPDILMGNIPATEIMFPGGSMELVQGIYKGSPVTDYYNYLAVWTLLEHLRFRLPHLGDSEKIKILEVGAGTGGTSALVFEAIRGYGDRISYEYTDISAGFIEYGKKQYGAENPYVDFKVLNIENDVENQGYRAGEYDVIIAVNVLHATRVIRNTLGNLKTLLKTNGWLILNEATETSEFTTLTFGLLEGWWLYEDESTRLKGSPLLSPVMWESVLVEQGFKRVVTLGRVSGQNVIIAESNGEVRRKDGKAISDLMRCKETEDPFVGLQTGISLPAVSNNKSTKVIPNKEKITNYIQDNLIKEIIKNLKIDMTDLHLEKPFSEYGVDSIKGVALIKSINQNFGISLRTTAMFDCGNVKDLSHYIYERYSNKISDNILIEDNEHYSDKDDLILLRRLASGELSKDQVYNMLEEK
jgi:acyl carrier protein